MGSLQGGTIKLNGTADKRIVFTSATATSEAPTFWGGLNLNSAAGSVISHVDLRFAGRASGSSTHPLHLGPTTEGQDPLLFDDVTIEMAQVRGFLLQNSRGVAPGSKIRIKGYAPVMGGSPLEPAVRVRPEAAATLGGGVIEIDTAGVPAVSQLAKLMPGPGNELLSSCTLPDLGVPYQLSEDLRVFTTKQNNTTISLTIDPGVTLKFSFASLLIGAQNTDAIGNLIARGTAEKPIVFTSAAASPAPGDWGTIFFALQNFEPMVSAFDHVTFEYGGGPTTYQVYSCHDDLLSSGVISIDGLGDYEGPAITNSTFTHAARDAIRARSTSVGTAKKCVTDYASKNNTFSDIKGANTPPLSCP